jgi:putative endonuclease
MSVSRVTSHGGFHETMLEVITREKQIKKRRRAWKIRRIEEHNPTWRDLSAELATL